jgi:hypothetical protein
MNTIRIALTLSLLMSFYASASTAAITSRDTTIFNKIKDSTLVYLDWAKMAPELKAKVITLMGKIAQKNNFYRLESIKENDNISLLIKRNYNVVEEKNKHTYDALVSLINEVNKYNLKNTLIAGAIAKMPRLPVQKSDTSKKEFTQFFNPYKRQAYILQANDLAESDLQAVQKDVDFSSAGMFAYKLSPPDLELFKAGLTKDTYNDQYGKAFVTLDSVKIAKVWYPDHTKSNTNVLSTIDASDSIASRYLQGLNKLNFGKYFVLDNFNIDSAHGQKVLDVINARFKIYGLDTLGIMIIPIPINYFDNLVFAKKALADYFALDDPMKKDVGTVELTHEAKILDGLDTSRYTYAKCKNCIPEVYLHALFRLYYRYKPDVISSSFWADMVDKNIFPRTFDESPTSLITAGLNEDGEIQQKLKNVLIENDMLTGAIQPINDYFDTYEKSGALIIGNRVDKGKFAGSHGTNITTTGLGVGWQGSTIRPTDLGTSFATPDVATKIFIAKAYWRSKGLHEKDINPKETRLRVLMSTDIDTPFVGKFDSGGSVNMIKLLQVGNYVELLSGEIVPIVNIDLKVSGIRYSANEAMPFGRTALLKGRTKAGICGLAYVDGSFYEFSESKSRWEATSFENISISFSTPSESFNIKKAEDFYSLFKQLIIIKNP